MNIRYLQKMISDMEDIIVIDRNVRINDVLCNVMGLLREEGKWQLLILQYDENYQRRIGEEEASYQEEPRGPLSNRELIRKRRRIDMAETLQTARKVCIGKEEYEIRGMELRKLGEQKWKEVYLISEFLRRGWKPQEIASEDMDMLFLARIELEAADDREPVFREGDAVRFIMGISHTNALVETPLTLTVNGENYGKRWFQDTASGEEHWVQIHQVYLLDMEAQLEETFANPKLLERMTQEELVRSKADLKEKLREICPENMYFPAIEYECEENISLQFYTKEYLDGPVPVNRNGSMGFMILPKQPEDGSGRKMKAAVIQQPVPKDTSDIEVEIFEYIESAALEDIILE